MGIWLNRFWGNVYYALHNIKFRITCKHVQIGMGSRVMPGSVLHGYNLINHHSTFGGELGYGSYIGYHSEIVQARFGKFCSVGPYVAFVSNRHPIRTFISSHPSFFAKKGTVDLSFVSQNTDSDQTMEEKIKFDIGHDVYIGQNSLILGPRKIGNGAVIGAGAVVTKDVPAYAIVVGCPAEIIGYRFEEDICNELNDSEWWNMDDEWLKQHSELFTNPTEFVKAVNKERAR